MDVHNSDLLVERTSWPTGSMNNIKSLLELLCIVCRMIQCYVTVFLGMMQP